MNQNFHIYPFSLGEFDVTVMAYKHLMHFSHATSKYPVVIGPVFVHVKKDFAAYHFLHFIFSWTEAQFEQ